MSKLIVLGIALVVTIIGALSIGYALISAQWDDDKNDPYDGMGF